MEPGPPLASVSGVGTDAPSDFDGFYLATRERLLHVLYAMVGDLAEAQDVVQEAYARAWQRWWSLSTYDEPVAGVRTVAWRLAVSRRFKARNRITVAVRWHSVPVIEPSTQPAAIVAALRSLPDAQRRALALQVTTSTPMQTSVSSDLRRIPCASCHNFANQLPSPTPTPTGRGLATRRLRRPADAGKRSSSYHPAL